MENKIIVFGGTGEVGQVIVQKLLDKEKHVYVLTRQTMESKTHLNHKVGNVLDIETIEQIIDQDDKIIISLGFNNSSLDTMSKGTANIIAAMKKIGAKRLVCLSAQGAGDSWNYMPDEFKEMVLNDKILKASFHDHGIQEDIVKKSDLEWTIVRPTEITGEKEKATFTKNSPAENSTFQISKFDVAQFIVDEIEGNNFIKQVVMITD
ncbi:MAG: NAD(P)H-binding protein [Bacteroidales bacterium]|nr:NAD(P)H-binding protein [Bacteroidales bacterium]